MAELHETLMGRKLIEGTLPQIAKQLERIAVALEKKEDLEPELTAKALIDFLEYEEAYTKDKESASRIRNLLNLLGIWDLKK